MPNLIKLNYLLPLLILGCSSGDAQQWSEFTTYPEAEKVQEYSDEQRITHQVSFLVEAEYPNNAVVEFYIKQVKEPWVPCFREVEWQSFGDGTRKPPAFIHQMLLHWVNYESNRTLVLAVRYVSDGGAYRKLPDNQTQYVSLAEYQQVSVEDAISDLGLVCGHT